MASVKSYSFTTPSNYTYDSDLIEVAGGNAHLEESLDCTFFADYTSSIDGAYGLGVLTGTAYNGAAVSGGKLDLTGETNKRVTYLAEYNADSKQVGCIRFLVTPNYTGSPVSEKSFIFLSTGPSSANSAIRIYHTTAGDLVYSIYNYTGSLIANAISAAWSPTASTEYEIELNWDIDTGANRIFVDGVQLGTTNTNSGPREAANSIKVGTNQFDNHLSDFEIDNLMFFSDVQHTNNYIPGDFLYSQDDPGIYPINVMRCDAISSFSATVTETGSDTVTFVMNVDSVNKYWSGAAWVASDGSVAQSNDASTINTNIATLVSAGAVVYPIVLLHSADGTTTPNVDQITMDYNFFIAPLADPTKCLLWGYIYDSSGNPLENQYIIVRLQSANHTLVNQMISTEPNYTTTDATGFFSIELIWSSELSSGGLYNITLRSNGYLDQTAIPIEYKIIGVTIPDQDSVELKDL